MDYQKNQSEHRQDKSIARRLDDLESRLEGVEKVIIKRRRLKYIVLAILILYLFALIIVLPKIIDMYSTI